MSQTTFEREKKLFSEQIYRAKLAEQVERYDEMVAHVSNLVKEGEKEKKALSADERNLVSLAYKQKSGKLRGSFRALQAMETQAKEALAGLRESEKSAGNQKVAFAKNYKEEVGDELRKLCEEIIGVVDGSLLTRQVDEPDEVYYIKMKADYYRYLAETLDAETSAKAAQVKNATDNYQDALQKAEWVLEPADPTRLGLALNYSVFMYEVLEAQSDAIALARSAFDGAIDELATLEKNVYKDATNIMQILRDNLNMWDPDRS